MSEATEERNADVLDIEEARGEGIEQVRLKPTKATKAKTMKRGSLTNVVAIVVVLVVVVAAGGYWFFESSSDSDDTQAEGLQSPLMENYVSYDVFSTLKQSVLDFKKDMKDIPGNIAVLQSKTDDLRSEMRNRKASVAILSDQMYSMEELLNKMGAEYSKLENIVSEKKQASSSKRNIPSFNFDLDGIGSWNGVPFVSVGYKGKYIMIEQGQRINGWLLEKLDPVSRVVEFKHTSGERVVRNV